MCTTCNYLLEPKRRTWEIHPSIVDRVMSLKPEHKTGIDFLEDLIVRGLNAGVADLTLPPLQSPHTPTKENKHSVEVERVRDREGLDGCREASGYKGRERERENKRYVFEVPDSLDWCKDQVEVYWKEAKVGKKTKHAAALLFTELEKIKSTYGEAIALEQIALATANNWKSITAVNYERMCLPKLKNYPKEPEAKHPAYKEWKDPYLDQPSTNDVIKDLLA